MRQKERVARWLPQGTTLQKASNRGNKVWAAICAQNKAGIHRYTLTSGVCCWDWWPTLADAEKELTQHSMTGQKAKIKGRDWSRIRHPVVDQDPHAYIIGHATTEAGALRVLRRWYGPNRKDWPGIPRRCEVQMVSLDAEEGRGTIDAWLCTEEDEN